MKYRVRVRPAAELDLLYSAGWYESKRAGLGDEFLDEMRRVIVALESDALLHQARHENVRLAFSRRFPYSIAYRIVDDEVVVLSVLHMRRQPGRRP
ncbi:MAG: type II toxin-antitoxin system RelE/ParE family toxin [Steroidobacteraceae bacterium]